MVKEECGSCRYWRPRSDPAGDSGGGYCVRFPPFFPSSLRLSPGLRTGDFEAGPNGDFLNDVWPMVHQQSWCGEYCASPALAPADGGDHD
jgi:hypothetical protein